ncbi:MAG: hypothetical protein Q4C95_01670 [Planctomycetia bacterium]|nr:hypothetical protein [Planctomycetia bacterium]
MVSENKKFEHHFYKVNGCGCVYSLVDNKGIIHLNAVISPDKEGDCQSQTFSVLKRLHAILEKERMLGSVAHQTVFLRNIGDKQLVRKLMIDYYGDNLPVITYVPQCPCDKDLFLVIEVHAIHGETKRVRFLRHDEHAITIDYSNISIGYFGDLIPDEKPVGAYHRAFNSFAKMRDILDKNGFSITNLLRTWIYQGNILLSEGKTQRYKELNRARTVFFEGTRFLENLVPETIQRTVYPASTGIGSDDVDVRLSAMAIQTQRKDVLAIPLENPEQTPAFDYGEVYSPQSPKFSRAMAVSYDDCCSIYVSGTASIINSETVFIDDIEGQTNQTLDNIKALISGDNMKKHGIEGYDAYLNNFCSARVYIKYPSDVEKVRAICEKKMGNTPVVYTISDICRDDLLVEIEGVVSCQRLAK